MANNFYKNKVIKTSKQHEILHKHTQKDDNQTFDKIEILKNDKNLDR